MNKRWLRLTAIVAEREIRQRGRSRAFMVSTIVLLLVVAAGVTIPAILAHSAKPQRVGIVGGQQAAMTEIVREAGHLTGTRGHDRAPAWPRPRPRCAPGSWTWCWRTTAKSW